MTKLLTHRGLGQFGVLTSDQMLDALPNDAWYALFVPVDPKVFRIAFARYRLLSSTEKWSPDCGATARFN